MVKKFTLFLLLGIFGLFTTNLFAQEDASIDPSAIKYWVGEGENEVVFIVNWNEPDTALAWGYRFDAETVTVKDMMLAIQEADYRFGFEGESFVSDVTFNDGVLDLKLAGMWWMYNVNGLTAGEYFDTQTVADGDWVKFGDESCGTLVDPQNYIYVWEKEVAPVYAIGEEAMIEESEIIYWVGEGDTADEAMQNIIGTVPVILLLILGILLLLFNSWRKVILVIMCFPFVICGIVPALLLMKIPFTFVAIIGLMGLMGMMVKNSIVLVDEIGRLKNDEKMSDFNAVVTAAVSRTRPVVMASLTTILGMIPLISDAMYNSMAIAIMFGLAVGTIITLVLLPVFYSALFGVKK